jgi:AraC-like DNA-binding protein
MGTKRKPNVLAQQINPELTHVSDLIQSSNNSKSTKETTLCRLEYLKKLYYFNLTEEDDNQGFEHKLTFSDQAIENLIKTGMPGDEFCEKYCFEKSVCSGRVIILFPKTVHEVPEIDPVKAMDKLAGVSGSAPFQQNLSWYFDDGYVKRDLLPGESLFLKNTISFIDACYKDYKFSVDLLSMKLNMSVSQVNRKLNYLTGHPAGYLIRLFRLQRSAILLLEGNKNVSEICFETGFNSLAYFCRSFKKHFGCSPTQYKKAVAEKLNIMRQKDN